MTVLLHLSDLHFGAPYSPAAGEAVHALAEALQPDLIAVSGDIVQWAEQRSAWLAARAFFDRFAAPLLFCPGNHDIRRIDVLRRLWAPTQSYEQHIAMAVDSVQHCAGASVASLVTPRRWSAELGHVSRRQLEFVQESFATAPAGNLRVVMMHHGLRQLMRLTRDCVWGGQRAGDAFSDMGVDLVLTGHNHYPHVERWRTGQLLWSQAGTATSQRFRALQVKRNSVSVLRADAAHVEVAWYFLEQGEQPMTPPRFVAGDSHLFARAR